VRKNEKRPHLKNLRTGLISIAVFIMLSGCHKTVQIPVVQEDIQGAAEAAKEGNLAFSRKDYYAALIKYLESVRLNPYDGYVYNRLGITYSQLKYFEQAAAAFMRAIELNPKYPYAYNNLGSVYFAERNLKKAEKYFKKAISLREDEATFHINMGSVLFAKKKDEKAKAEVHKALVLDPDVMSKNVSVSMLGDKAELMRRAYFFARAEASHGNVEAAIKNLQMAITNGFTDLDLIQKETDFDPVRNEERFIDFLDNAALLIKLRQKVGLPEDSKK
jgi:tetratricopeptide (TPR) repeat protein